MGRAFVVAVLGAGMLAVPGAVAQPPQEKKAELVAAKPGGVAHIVDALQNYRISYEKDLVTTPLAEVLSDLSKRYEIAFIIDKASFEEAGEGLAGLDDSKATRLGAPKLEGLTLHTFLHVYLRSLSVPNVTYLVREDYIEITSLQSALKQAGLDEAIDESLNSEDPIAAVKAQARLKLPLVSVVVEDRPLSEVLRTLSRVYGLNIVLYQEARDSVKARLTERLLNVPADTALELLAGQAGLSVVRKGNTFRIGLDGGF
jgi:hypothetical protein